ncbi:hypothetical protein [Rubritalea sp.]|uniref:hypothetical protein n=1 Tax=Rubritalea sp. TaxID=2109375 RepID=UPI003EF36329
MVLLKSHKAFGSFLGSGTHVWLEVHSPNAKKVTFSGARVQQLLGVVENHRKDYNKPPTRGSVIIPAPDGLSEQEWAERVIEAGRTVKKSMSKRLRYHGLLPCLPGYGNCCTVVNWIIGHAGGTIPSFRPAGIAPGLTAGC